MKIVIESGTKKIDETYDSYTNSYIFPIDLFPLIIEPLIYCIEFITCNCHEWIEKSIKLRIILKNLFHNSQIILQLI